MKDCAFSCVYENNTADLINYLAERSHQFLYGFRRTK